MLEHMKDENEILREKFKLEQEKECLQKSGENLVLSEELGLVGNFSSLFYCESCDESFESQNNFKSHKKEHHKEQSVKNILKKKVNVLESSILKQKFALSSNLLELKEKEEKRKHICQCKGYCKIRHIFYNWSKPKSDEILTKAKIVLDNQVDVEDVEEGVFEKECYQCEHCDSNFVNS